MLRSQRLIALAPVVAALSVLAACGSGDNNDNGGGSTKTTADQASACTKGQLALTTSGQLTVGTDKPAFPPYFEDDDPTNGKGFESAVAYAVAKQLGFGNAEVKWTVVPFNSSYAPGPKKFDFDINQISITPPREKVVDFSSPYYTAPQAVVVPKGSDLAGASSLADLKDATIGVQIGTTSLDAAREVIKPNNDVKVFNDSNDVVTALKQNQVDAVVLDLPTAFYLTAAQVPGAKIVGQFSAPGGDQFGLLLAKGSKLTPCVNDALAKLDSSGELQQITEKWMGAAAGAPELR
ncbi:MAG: polar amino acid transport system substrate-binding protein [Thermoleophilaceae bacterium]|jgi:polar amino acid transport system substrate-binding protein|nr:polar amino acid transport system substrate-binding protein [Thermoleophilaceae bacterium]